MEKIKPVVWFVCLHSFVSSSYWQK